MTADLIVGERPITIAIVDDEPSVRVGLHRLCTALGLTATAYASGRAFLDALCAGPERPDCVLLDTQMAGMTGLEVQRDLVRRGLGVPAIVMTADDAPETRARCLAAGAADYLRKPIGEEELVLAIERTVRATGTGGKSG